MEAFFDWLTGGGAPHAWLAWLAGASVFMFALGLVGVPLVLVRLPADYFTRPAGRHPRWPALALLWLVARNLLGGVLVLAGFAMLVLPGQGLLSILLGLSLTTFPGKRRLERFLVSRPPVYYAINALRRRAGRLPLDVGK